MYELKLTEFSSMRSSIFSDGPSGLPSILEPHKCGLEASPVVEKICLIVASLVSTDAVFGHQIKYD